MDLNPCPFCGYDETTIESVYLFGKTLSYQVSCPFCRARGPSSPSEEIAVTYWNSILGRSISVIGDSASTDDPHS